MKTTKKAEFQFTVLSDKYNWEFSSDDKTQLKGKDASIRNLLSGEYMILGFRKASELISVGTASCEGGTATENERSKIRAGKLDEWLQEALEKHDLKDKPRYTLNLGKYKGECSPKTEQETAPQRRIIIIGIIDRDKDVNLSEALRNAMEKRQDLSFYTKNYSLFKLD
ncbi:hypothetical protein [Okeania sp. KiyG1]|uniref:hypothetical protein n=1 Tax=Okeania sp. KiyG1 TaxID=2720165 RepID=UPI00192492B2|nr:hypothetical protein [Okeania sp. KiyG1]GGA09165.1 hypothetical protein CYANOKiyG1_22050 [Okeania sp. KiyG1]